MKVVLLASGSSGNSIYIEGNGTSILIDAGLSGVQLEKRMEAAHVNPAKINAILVTHEHGDHIRGVGVMSRRYNLPVFATPGTWHGAPKSIGKIRDKKIITRGEKFDIGGIQIHPFATSHDVNEPVGFTFQINGYKIGLATDLGFVTRLVGRRLEGSNLLILESNHDVEMLKVGPYPWQLKQRILGKRGHLSNIACNDALTKLAHDELEIVAIAHLSKENNCPDLAKRETQKILREAQRHSTKLFVGNPDKPRVILDN